MIEKIITSKTRVKLLELFLTHIDDRYYLRELERKLDESVSPLRRQLLKLEKMGILTTKYEANLKYYRLNRGFAGMEELRRLVLGGPAEGYVEQRPELAPRPIPMPEPQVVPAQKRMRYDIATLTVISFFVLATAVFIVYTNSRNINQVAGLVSEKRRVSTSQKKATVTRPDEMASRRWKVFSGSVPVLSSGGTDGEKRSEEL